ncbi:MAG: hypothetical protein QOI12_3441 [Alphaproteobacteria bacterium]|jgi:hypothetical protein|nr:hypothetical protein [Alphaproteobacteria bacterium]
MILAALAASTLLVGVATGPMTDPGGPVINLSAGQKNAAVQPLVRRATECITRTVTADTRYRQSVVNVGDLIVDSMQSCVAPVRAMIDAYDHYFGEGTGEAFFMGPYLDVLPAAVTKWVTDRSE